MQILSRLVKTPHNQFVELPKGFHLSANEVWLSQNQSEGEIKLTPVNVVSRTALDQLEFFLTACPFPEDFSFRDESTAQEMQRNVFD